MRRLQADVDQQAAPIRRGHREAWQATLSGNAAPKCAIGAPLSLTRGYWFSLIYHDQPALQFLVLTKHSQIFQLALPECI